MTQNTSIIQNPGSVYAEPVMAVYGSGDITLMVNLQIIELTGIEDSIFLDSDLKEAYKGSALMNDHMSGDFPILNPGSNAISWSGNLTKINIKPNWRYL